MAVALNNIVSINNDGAAEPISYNAGTGANRVLLVAFSISFEDTNPTNSVTYAGNGLTLAASITDPFLYTRSEIWYTLTPASGSNTLNVSTGDDTVVSLIVTYASGADTGSIGAVGSKQGESTDVNVDITPTRSGSLLLACLVSNANTNFAAAGGSTVQALAGPPFVGGQGMAIASKISTSLASHNIAATSTPSDGWSATAVEIKEGTKVRDVMGMGIVPFRR